MEAADEVKDVDNLGEIPAAFQLGSTEFVPRSLLTLLGRRFSHRWDHSQRRMSGR